SMIEAGAGPLEVAQGLYDLVKELELDDETVNRQIGQNGAALLKNNSTVYTHCNAGSLATGYFGTALGVIYTANDEGKIRMVYADETRPVNQGFRISAWELARAGVPTTIVCDDMAAYVMSNERPDAVIVGADRIADNGDAANKIGTLGLAVLAKHYGIPFYVAAPLSTIDHSAATGADIPIEQRDASEVMKNPPDGVQVLNPAFDVTPAELITAIITEAGVFKPDEIKDL
ncbi:MAG: S-methyl-5-thioribose-1-phosphate isomerase, partial [Eggerthellaceae bacterium]|nr:S-methyl-5-thioribose-1-phosphate isomerase [Eggerthellaceae bacterium]